MKQKLLEIIMAGKKKDARFSTEDALLDFFDEQKKAIHAKYTVLDSSQITDDAKLLEIPGALSKDDFYGLHAKYHDNPTMTRLIERTAERDGVYLDEGRYERAELDSLTALEFAAKLYVSGPFFAPGADDNAEIFKEMIAL